MSESAEAKVLGREEVGSSLGAGSEAGGFGAKGFEGVDEADENGFEGADVPVENGFVDEGPANGFVPNKDSPIWVTGFADCNSLRFASLVFLSLATTSDTLSPRNMRMLPCFRLQVLRLHVKMYSQRSWPGKLGTSPFS